MNGMADGEGRSSMFGQGATETKFPTLPQTRQQHAGGNFRAQSVLDQPNIVKSSNGLSLQDHDRLTVGGGMLPSANGQSQGTYEKSQWLSSPYRTFG